MPSASSVIPAFREDGYLPEGLHVASEAEVIFRFGATTRRRRRLAIRLRRWLKLARRTNSRRLFADGSFVTAKDEPGDVDAVVLLASNFQQQIDQEVEAALELEPMLLTRNPEDIFAAEDEQDWREWIDFFSRKREVDGRHKGLVEVQL